MHCSPCHSISLCLIILIRLDAKYKRWASAFYSFLNLSRRQAKLRRKASSWMLRRVAIVRTDVSVALSSSETSVLTRATRHNIPGDSILHSHRRENLKSYKAKLVSLKNSILLRRVRANIQTVTLNISEELHISYCSAIE
jgi:hypothetical protein